MKGRRLLIAAAVVATVLAGLGAAAQAGILSRAEANGNDSSRSAAAAIGDPSTGQDVIAVGETNTSVSSEDESYHASATALRVGDTKVGEAPAGSSEPLAALNGQPTEQLIDGAATSTATSPRRLRCAHRCSTAIRTRTTSLGPAPPGGQHR